MEFGQFPTPRLEEIHNDVESAVAVMKYLHQLLRKHFLNRKIGEDASLDKLLKSSTLIPSVQHVISKSIVKPINEILRDFQKPSTFSTHERSQFLACSRAVFSYLEEKQKLTQTIPERRTRQDQGRHQGPAGVEPKRMNDYLNTALEDESDRLDYSIVAKLVYPRLLCQKSDNVELTKKIIHSRYRHIFKHMIGHIIIGLFLSTATILTIFMMEIESGNPLRGYVLTLLIFTPLACLFLYVHHLGRIDNDSYYIRIKRDIIEELDKNGLITGDTV